NQQIIASVTVVIERLAALADNDPAFREQLRTLGRSILALADKPGGATPDQTAVSVPAADGPGEGSVNPPADASAGEAPIVEVPDVLPPVMTAAPRHDFGESAAPATPDITDADLP